MPDYKAMYLKLLNATTDAYNLLANWNNRAGAIRVLAEARREVEEMCVGTENREDES